MTSFLAVFSELASNHAPALLASLALLCASAAFSSGETALFSLSPAELNRLRAGERAIDSIVLRLHRRLQSLLPCLLFFNMMVNVAIYTIAGGIAADLGGKFGMGVAFAYSMASLLLVVFWGEVFPKQLAIAASLRTARLAALPVWIVHRVLGKPLKILNALVSALERALDAHRPDNKGLREEELRLLVELSRDDGAISDGEYQMIDSIVELPEVRVKDIMTPRIDAATLPPDASPEDAIAEARRRAHCKIPVFDAAADDFAGWIDARAVFAARIRNPSRRTGGAAADDTIEPFLRGFVFFSEHDRADQVLERLKTADGDLCAVVDERGVVVGFFTLQDIMDEVLGRFGEHGAAPPPAIREAREGYVISGRLSVREWRDLFDVSRDLPKSATVGGLVVSLLGRVPRAGDRVSLDNMEMTVLSTWHNRVTEVGLRLADGERDRAEKKISARFFTG